MSCRIWRSFVAILAAAKRPAYSASATKVQTTGIRVEWRVGRNGVIEWGVVVVVAEYAETPGHTSGAGSGEIRGIRERAKNHLGGPKNVAAVGVGGISEEAVQSLHRVGRGRSLLRGQGTGGGQETRVDSAAII